MQYNTTRSCSRPLNKLQQFWINLIHHTTCWCDREILTSYQSSAQRLNQEQFTALFLHWQPGLTCSWHFCSMVNNFTFSARTIWPLGVLFSIKKKQLLKTTWSPQTVFCQYVDEREGKGRTTRKVKVKVREHFLPSYNQRFSFSFNRWFKHSVLKTRIYQLLDNSSPSNHQRKIWKTRISPSGTLEVSDLVFWPHFCYVTWQIARFLTI